VEEEADGLGEVVVGAEEGEQRAARLFGELGELVDHPADAIGLAEDVVRETARVAIPQLALLSSSDWGDGSRWGGRVQCESWSHFRRKMSVT
jgi:hypothetical protein